MYSFSDFSTCSLIQAKKNAQKSKRIEAKYAFLPERLSNVLQFLYEEKLHIVCHDTTCHFSYRNLYYDTKDFLLFKHWFDPEKVRIRARIYQDDYISWEVNRKKYGVLYKNKKHVNAVPSVYQYDDLQLFPQLYTMYQRVSFVDPSYHVRYTIDTDIQCALYTDTTDTVSYGCMILEVKADHSRIIDINSRLPSFLRKNSFSKYEYAVRYLSLV